MLQYLQIQDLALIDKTTLEFEDGFTCITGETGAGKSVLLGALAMLSGNRIDRTVIRHGQNEAKVEAVISIPNPEKINAKLEALELPPCEEGALLLSRSVHIKKAPKIKINGSLSTLGALAEIGEFWIDFHGPGEPQKLHKEKYQLELLDLFSKANSALGNYRKTYQNWRAIAQQLENIRNESQLSEDEIHYLQDQIRKIDELGPDETSIEALENQFQRMSRSEELVQLLASIQNTLFDESSASEKLAQALQTSISIQQIDTSSDDLWKRLESVSIELDDLRTEIEDLAQSVNFDDLAVEELKYKMELWMELKVKFGKSTSEILRAKATMEEKLETHGDIESTLLRLETELTEARKTVTEKGSALTELRKKGAKQLSQKVSAKLKNLGFKKALFEIEVSPESEPKESGLSTCKMLFAPNAGQPLLPLNKIASSGETARVMLGLKAVLAAFDQTPVLVFDEVDSNVGGEIGKAVGTEIAVLANDHQIFCVTHLPQVASQANEHFVVLKSQTNNSTDVSIKQLESQGETRIIELARMLGDRTSQTALTHARELLDSQQNLNI